jgi:hypothetical protein
VKHPVTPDGRYFVVRGRIWRMANSDLANATRANLVGRLMAARRAVRDANKAADRDAQAAAPLGERGSVWWDDGSPDLNRHMAKNTIYADWYAGLSHANRAWASFQNLRPHFWRGRR